MQRTKSKRNRTVAITAAMETFLKPVAIKVKSGRIFKMEDGTELREDYIIKKVLPRACKKAGVSYIGSHASFRHTFASHYMMNGGNLWDLKGILGHSDQKITDEKYAHFSKDHIKNRAKVFGVSNIINVDFGRGSPSGSPQEKNENENLLENFDK